VIVDKRWAIIIVVLSLAILTRVCLILSSASASRELVGSSSINIEGSRNIALAIAILCLSPPDKLAPFYPTIVS